MTKKEAYEIVRKNNWLILREADDKIICLDRSMNRAVIPIDKETDEP